MGGGELEPQGARATGWAERKPRSSPMGRKCERDVPTPWGLRGATRNMLGQRPVRNPRGTENSKVAGCVVRARPSGRLCL